MGKNINMVKEYSTIDYMLDNKQHLIQWSCHWRFELQLNGTQYVYRAAYESAPGCYCGSEHIISRKQAEEIAHNLSLLDKHALFKPCHSDTGMAAIRA